MISIFLASILCAGAPLAEDVASNQKVSTAQPASNSFEIGSVIIEKVRADYVDGTYNEFLKQMDEDYNQAKASNGLDGLIEMRKESAKVNIHPEFVRSQTLIQDAKNKNLLAAAENDNSRFAEKVRSAAATNTPESQLLNSFHYKLPGTGINADENTLIDNDLEYTYKIIHLDTLLSPGTDKREKQIVLEMERMDKLVKVSKSFEDKELQQAIATSAANLDQRLTKKYDMKDLHDLSNGKVKPTTALEEKAGAIVGNAQGQIVELHRQLLNHLDSNEPVAETVQK